ncbi:hypothetical protein EIL87_08880 [Saccharopolyspora rhizosphaerae]|uniref:Uncharacterized protein n=1 Tax=Saccharopolyspora rhizosphaerae TaxID=2492662 RepID=A0A3R8Q702_9PSEU|nr:hypothetical protein [Saccharopolyspora rhizosphaerae]RRO18329.1 hypothetical protein EIL87_08880 [Saccharopolyspora rhizosphaerae]
MLNSLTGFAVAASVGLGTVLFFSIFMSWVERGMIGSGTSRRGRHRRRAGLAVAYRRHRAALLARGASLPAVTAVVETARRPRGRVVAGGPGAMRRPGPRHHSFDPPTAPRSRRSRTPVTPRT